MDRTITLTPELAYRAICPSTAFWDHGKYSGGDVIDAQLPWDHSPLNPKNRIDSLTPVRTPKWRIDGCTSLGTQFFAVPISISPLPPLRVDTFLPDPAHWPAQLRLDLDFEKAFLFRDSRTAYFGISQHILRALEFWSASIADFETVYRDLTFGSRIMFENIAKDVRDIRVRIIRTHDLERQLLSLADLKLNQQITLPGTLDISQLTLVRQFQDSASLVRILGSDDIKHPVVFKTLSDTPKYLYHELGTLLSLPEHANVISKPEHIITKQCKFGGKVAVVGFTIQYHRQGSLRDVLAHRRHLGTLTWEHQIKWACQIVMALRHIKSQGPGWYCDLRLDNVLLSNEDDVVLIDFEQRGVLPAFASPLDNYLQYVNVLVNEPLLHPAARKEYADLYDTHIRPFVPKRTDQHRGCVPWLCMSKSERDASELYILARLLWCIFEGVCAPQRELWMEYMYEPDIEFPEFRRTPKELRELILICTPSWNRVVKTLQRKAFKLNIRGSSDDIQKHEKEALAAIVDMWHGELHRAKDFLSNRRARCEDISGGNVGCGSLKLDRILQKLQQL
ncbi:hypothetical protein ONS95_008451 [Cadophora gregata]|uniref:uncharacterized protein n=1 Tax=Cadophora gregata TaxID=51156 RepID=UPI0026DB8F62|nr:uncharacterized protein ONS95_008451 [Cadophora gregata]KAK0126872.1 hypothetical protein ONS95_008451 [Cadophora gregata]